MKLICRNNQCAEKCEALFEEVDKNTTINVSIMQRTWRQTSKKSLVSVERQKSMRIIVVRPNLSSGKLGVKTGVQIA